MRHELTSLHSAWAYPGAQFYPSCFQVAVTGSGSATGPAQKVAFPGAYSATTPGVVFDIYQGTGDYTIPGPVCTHASSGVVVRGLLLITALGPLDWLSGDLCSCVGYGEKEVMGMEDAGLFRGECVFRRF